MINKTDKTFDDISTELWREYTTPAGTFRINLPQGLNVSDNGHRVYDDMGVGYYIDTRKGFFLKWKPRHEAATFVK